MKIINVSDEISDIKLYKFISNSLKLPITLVYKLIRKKKILINDKKVDTNYQLKKNDKITIKYNKNEEIEQYKSTLDRINDYIYKNKIYEDDNLLVFNKSPDMYSQDGTNIKESIASSIIKINNEYRIVHRLDKETSGTFVIAKNFATASKIGKLLIDKKIKKIYFAILSGILREEKLIKIKTRKIFKRMEIDNCGEENITKFIPISYFNGFTLCKIIPFTGKMHQIRISAEYIGTPIVGDNIYNGYPYKRCLLHCHSMQIWNKLFIASTHKDFNNFLSNN